jgi:hypothetical protein
MNMLFSTFHLSSVQGLDKGIESLSANFLISFLNSVFSMKLLLYFCLFCSAYP